jgi:hypothetical protein
VARVVSQPVASKKMITNSKKNVTLKLFSNQKEFLKTSICHIKRVLKDANADKFSKISSDSFQQFLETLPYGH